MSSPVVGSRYSCLRINLFLCALVLVFSPRRSLPVILSISFVLCLRCLCVRPPATLASLSQFRLHFHIRRFSRKKRFLLFSDSSSSSRSGGNVDNSGPAQMAPVGSRVFHVVRICISSTLKTNDVLLRCCRRHRRHGLSWARARGRPPSRHATHQYRIHHNCTTA